MSLTVPADVLERARVGTVSDDEFIAVIESSLPYPFKLISDLVDRAEAEGGFADNTVPPAEACKFAGLAEQ